MTVLTLVFKEYFFLYLPGYFKNSRFSSIPLCRKIRHAIFFYILHANCWLQIKVIPILQAFCNGSSASLLEIYSQTEEDWIKNSFLLPETGGTCSLFPLNLLNLH